MDWVKEFWAVVMPYVKARTKSAGQARGVLLKDMREHYLTGYMLLGDEGKTAFLDVLRD